MREQIKTTIILVLGWSFILLGVIGLFLPILQGVLFILIGLFLLAKRSRWARKLMQRILQRYPSLADHLKVAQSKGEGLIIRIKALVRKRNS